MGTDEPSVFEITADYQETKLDEYEREFDRWIAEPAKILWSDYRGRFGILLITVYILMGTVGVVVLPEPRPNMGPRLQAPFQDIEFLLGTDGMGQGLLSLMVHSTPPMFQMILAGAVFGNLMGVTVGLFAGYLSGTTDKVLMTIVDVTMAIPAIPLLIILVTILEPTNPYLIGVVLALPAWAGGARSIRAQVFPLRDEEHVEAAKAYGQPMSSLLVKDILPHLLPLIFIGFLGGATGIIFASVGLYFLGLLPFDDQNWGVVLQMAYAAGGALYTIEAAHWIIVPLITITGLTVATTLLAQAFDQVFNPRVRARHRKRKMSGDEMVEEGQDQTHASAQQTTRGTI